MEDRDKHWAMLEAELTALLNSFASSIDTETFGLVQDFIENREYGVALEWLYLVVVVESKLPLSPLQARKIDELAGVMEIDLQELEP
jgi:hypothetical protein